MIAASVAWLFLSAVLVTVSGHHALVWLGNTGAREHLWFTVCALATATAAAIQALGLFDPFAPAPSELAAPVALTWMVAATWFAVEYSDGDLRRRRAAMVVSVLLALACACELATRAGDLTLPGGWSLGSRVVAAVAVVGAIALVIEGAWRLWPRTPRIRAVILGSLGLVVAFVGLLSVQTGPGLPAAALLPFLAVAMLLTYELARQLAHSQLAAERQHHELPQASRLSVATELTAAIAHEINQPLGAILSNADAGEMLIDGGVASLDQIRLILADIRRDGLRASNVIRNMRSLVRKREPDLAVVDGNALATGVRALLDTDIRRRRIAVAVKLSPEPVNLIGDRILLEQVLINLVVNAMDAVESLGGDLAGSVGPPVVMAVSRTEQGYVEFSVSDAGPGIPVKHLGHLFDSFHTTKPHGMGLGLAICRSLVQVHGGRIHAANLAHGGAVFRASFPAHEGE